jgi:hypothetical protein
MDNAAPVKKSSIGAFVVWILVSLVIVSAIGVIAWYLLYGGMSQTTRVRRVINTGTPTQQVVVNMQGQWKGEDKREDYIVETLKEFETRNPQVRVNVKWNSDFPGGREGAIEATINQFKTGKIDWDIIWLEPFYYQKIATSLNDQDWANHFLVDFEAIPDFKATQKSFILSDPQYRDHFNGIIAGPFMEGFYQPFFYNKELTDMMGIQVKDTGMTVDDLLGYFKQVDDYNKAHGTRIPILYDSGDYKGGIGYAQSVFNIFQSLFRSEFSSLAEVEDKTPSDAKMAAVRKVLGSLEEMSKYKPLIPGWKDLDWWGTRYYVLDDKAVFTACGASWMYSQWHGIDSTETMKMVPVEMPAYRPVNHYMGGYNSMFAVAKDSRVRDEAVKLLMSFSTPNAAEKWVRYAKAPSGVKGNISTAGGVSPNSDQFDRFIAYITDKYGGNVFDSKTVDYIIGGKYKDLTVKFNMHLGDVVDGKVTADEAYKAILNDMKIVDEGKPIIN